MDPVIIVAIVVAALVIGAAAAWLLLRQRRRAHLRERFGPEYDRTISRVGDRARAEHELERREHRVDELDIRPLDPNQSEEFAARWRRVQAEFVDAPSRAVLAADDLVAEVMQRRGYPVGDFEQRAADVSVEHPLVVENYRAARATADRNRRGEASTEDLRLAMVHYRALFEDLLDSRPAHDPEVRVDRAS